MTPLPAVEKVQDVDVTPPLDCDIAADAPAEAAPAPARVDPDKDAAANAKARLLRYVKFVICDVLDVESVQQGLAENLGRMKLLLLRLVHGWVWMLCCEDRRPVAATRLCRAEVPGVDLGFGAYA